ncbi:hypothetical protein WR25_21465 [Diploscapter pachys]|uniref:Olfactomedin-like domain-containing protein n=1 Tax=Diploscapter pachys TaxID=2018661 RepID=A0A2A2JF11_9BILA|nr:hypothetical protein WR25_21465 [Diploscapter pachys]
MAGVSIPVVISWLLTLCTIGLLLYQRQTISNLENELLEHSVRTRRSADDRDNNLVYLPVYAQISRKAMKRICMQHRFEMNTNKRKEKSNFLSKEEPKRKKCKSDMSFDEPRLIAERTNSIGAAMRDGEQWYLTEFDFGYTIIKFLTSKKLNNSEPTELYTLPIPFRGTDNTACLFNLNFWKSLYDQSDSRMDIQAEEHGIWVTYRDERDFFAVSRLHPSTLKIISNWSLPAIHPEALCNSFIRCGILYSVECTSDSISFSPVYDFYKHIYVSGRKHTIQGISNVTMVQYDPNSKSIALFSSGSIYSIGLV